ncbi:MAG: methyltransferase domain-containing protein [Defluviitaleaceae bacterium]|nr:methyltransferase domain-containing protein [Defluviitaleaceae bacterium]
MKENKYDDDNFFKEYSNMSRSLHGLNAAGEWEFFKRLLPDFLGKKVLDIGCGFGWHCNYAASLGAAYVLGLDISENMIKTAREKTTAPNVEYKIMPMEDIDFENGAFDVVISSLALHYSPDFLGICEKVYKYLTDGGSFVFSVEHPIFTAEGTQKWVYNEAGNLAHWPLDRYFEPGLRNTVFLGEKVIKYHRSLTDYVGALLDTGFELTGFVEPMPDEKALKEDPDMKDELRRPMFLLLAGRK